MTLEGHGPPGEDTPAPPALTRWSQEGADDDPELLPPYVPGASRTPPRPGASHDETARPDDRTPIEQVEAAATAEPEPAEAVENPFPFDMPAAGAPQAGSDDEFPVQAFDIDGSIEEEGEAAGATGWAGSAEAAEAEARSAAAAESAGAAPEGRSERVGDESEAEAVAARLDRLARALRSGGRSALEHELAAGDRVTALLAGVVAGYLAGLED